MTSLNEINEKIKHLKNSRDILQSEYSKSEFHKKKEEHPDSSTPAINKAVPKGRTPPYCV